MNINEEKESKEKQQTNMSFGETNKIKEEINDSANKNYDKNSLNKSVKFSEKKIEDDEKKIEIQQNNSFSNEPRFGQFKKIKEILHHSKCGVQTPGQAKPNQDNYCIKKNIFNEKNLDNYFFAVL